ncbi:MAG: hypothetical protein GIW97_01035 [Candidatus Eremiobacteraeota bacterium]|nr:hypothetical protein [Candidatus Eremiobacteraeota bacterium]
MFHLNHLSWLPSYGSVPQPAESSDLLRLLCSATLPKGARRANFGARLNAQGMIDSLSYEPNKDYP